MGLFLTFVLGLIFAACGVSYKVSAIGKAEPVQNAACMAFLGMVLFGILAGPEWQFCSWRIAAMGAVLGASLYAGIVLLQAALKVGPLSPAWCAQALVFIPVILYARIFLGEMLSCWQVLSILATVGAIIAAAGNANGGAKAATRCDQIRYAALLLALLGSLSIFNIGLKFSSVYCEPGSVVSMASRSANLMLFFAYATLAILGVADLSWRRRWRCNRYAWTGGAMLAVAGTCAHGLTLAIVDKVPAAILFALSNATSILVASVLSTLFFQEKRTANWYWTVGFSLLAVILNH